MRRTTMVQALMAALALAPALAHAITDDEVNRVLQFNFSNPGARSLGLGGAFTGLADDATAGYANPAGLTILRTQEFSAEARYTSFDTPYASGGTVINNPFNTGGVGEASGSDSVTQLSFASWVYPTERATFSLYYHRVGDFQADIQADAIEFVNANGNPTDQYLAANAQLSYLVQNYGAAVGFKVSDTFSIGGSIAYSDFTISSRNGRFIDENDTQPFNEQRQRGSDNDVIYALGALWQVTPQWSLGLAYNHGGDFSYQASNEVLGSNPLRRLDRNPSFKVPNVFSAGLAFRPSDAWLLSLDVNRIEYSRLSDGLVTIFDDTPGAQPQPLAFKDGTEIRFGAEYAFLEMSTPFFLRGGVWRDPDHSLQYDRSRPANCNDFDACLAATLFRHGSDETHYSLGVGWAFTKFELNLAADMSDLVDTYSVSGKLQF